MELKRVLARDSRSATAKAIALYGKDALIVSNAKVGGQVEVIVAVDVEPHAEPDAGPVLATPAERIADTAVAAPASAVQATAFDALLSRNLTVMQEFRPVAAQVHADVLITQAAAEAGRGRELVDMIRQVFLQMQREFLLSKQFGQGYASQPVGEQVQATIDSLEEVGVPAALRTTPIGQIGDMTSGEEAFEAIEQTLLAFAHHQQSGAAWQPGVHVILGPSGSGKTLAVARIAKAAAAKESAGVSRVAIISYGNHRHGSWSQLQLLCANQGVDCFRAPCTETLVEVLAEVSDHRLVLVDTLADRARENLADIAALCPSLQRHLLLPVDAALSSLRRYVRIGEPLTSLIITKLDEASNPWPLIRAVSVNPMLVSFLSQGVSQGMLAECIDLQAWVKMAIGTLRSSMCGISGVALLGHEPKTAEPLDRTH